MQHLEKYLLNYIFFPEFMYMKYFFESNCRPNQVFRGHIDVIKKLTI